MSRCLPLMLGAVTLVLFAMTMAAVAIASNSQSPSQQELADNAAEESGSLEFVVSSVIGRALNVPGTY